MSTPPDTDPRKSKDEIPWKKVAFIALAVYSVLFLILNDKRVGVSFVLFTAETSLIFLILISMGLGAALAIFGPAWWRRRKRRRSSDQAARTPVADPAKNSED
jgi:uncharacterized integral membrane protein